MKITILRIDTVDSTNSEAARQAQLGADEGLCVIARRQTAGRGRHGRTWISEKDAGLYFSIILRPKIEIKFLPLITLMTGVAVYDTLEECGLKPDIKWVNDILIGEKKICGILAESVETQTGLAVVVGVGINLTSQNFAADIGKTITSINAELATPADAGEIERTLTKYISYWYENLCGENGPTMICSEWKRRSSYFHGKNVRVTLANESFEGATNGLEENGALRVKIHDGTVKIVQAGDVERLRPFLGNQDLN